MWGKSNATSEFQSQWANCFYKNFTLNNPNRGLYLFSYYFFKSANQRARNSSIMYFQSGHGEKPNFEGTNDRYQLALKLN